MKRVGLSTWLALLSLAAVALVAIVDVERTSPGPLANVHQGEEDLAGGTNCAACHGGWFRSMAQACLDCHAPIEEQIDARAGLHGAITRGEAMRCGACHSEHHGLGFAMVNRQSFALAGVPDPEAFDHGLVGFDMSGEHLELDCTKCHANAATAVLAKGEQRFLGLSQDCASCHEDVHEGAMAVSCATCHGQEAFDQLHSIGHERVLPLVGGHGDVSCRTCHAEDGPRALEVVGGRGAQPPERTCLDCHASPHAAGFAEGAARLAGMPLEQGCVSCHAAEHASFREEGLTISAEQHALTGFPLAEPHAELGCAACHWPQVEAFAERYPARGADDCSRCHADPHGGQFEGGRFSPAGDGDCLACHDRLRFEPHGFTLDMHQRAAFALDGAHAEADCSACHHLPEDGSPRVFAGTAQRCEQCHADAHDGFFDARARELAAAERGECARCHLTERFDDVPAERFDHGAWTGFPVQGAHAEEGCAACHAPAPAPDEAGRSFGRVAELFGPFEGCATCHADPHQGQFDGPGKPLQVDGREGCARCHVETSFRAFADGFEHGSWTGYPLAGAHAAAACSACHAPLRPADALGRTWGRALGSGCADCHADPHGGQFAAEGEGDCARCHTSARADLLAFDHERDARFALGAAHAEVACSACHMEVEQAGTRFVRYRPLGTQCVDCHGVHEEVLLRRKSRTR